MASEGAFHTLAFTMDNKGEGRFILFYMSQTIGISLEHASGHALLYYTRVHGS
jgi:hypothetical protein